MNLFKDCLNMCCSALALHAFNKRVVLRKIARYSHESHMPCAIRAAVVDMTRGFTQTPLIFFGVPGIIDSDESVGLCLEHTMLGS